MKPLRSASEYPGLRDFKPIPWDFPRRSFLVALLSLVLASLSGAAYLYAENAFPHGPKVFVGTDVQCMDRGPCREVPLFVEDTSQLDNPGWVGVVRDWGWLPPIVLVVTGVFKALAVWEWWVPRRRVIWPQRRSEWVTNVSAAIDEWMEGRRWKPGPGEWQVWNRFGRVLCGMKMYREALGALSISKQQDLNRQKELFAQWLGPKEESQSALQLAERWHQENIAYVRAKMTKR